MKLAWFSSSEVTLVLPSESTVKTPEADATIPPALPGRTRTLVLCFDGTGDTNDADRTNVAELWDMLKKPEELCDILKKPQEEQLVYYQRGIGTYTPKIPGVKERIKIPGVSAISQKWDQATAWSLNGHVIEAYLWLVDNYIPGDKISMFGFSRGSYTARAVAGMLFKVGLLPKNHREKADAAFKSYEIANTTEGWEHSMAFQKTWGAIDVPIDFVGCWDTVNSVGSWTTKTLPFTAYNPLVRVFRHAVALDERRAKFRTNLWSPSDKAIPGTDDRGLSDLQKMIKRFVEEKSKELPSTHVDEVWFAGCHCDVGGGAVENGTKQNLAHIPLRWMIRECFKQNTGIMFRKDKLELFHLNPDNLYPIVKDRPSPVAPESNIIQTPTRLGPIDTVKGWVKYLNPFKSATSNASTHSPRDEEDADAIDALAPIYDMLNIKPQMWLIFENIPLKVYDYNLGKYVGKRFNKKPRGLRGPVFVDLVKKVARPLQAVRVHRTVLARMNSQHADGTPYVPRALLAGKAISLDVGLAPDQKLEWVS